MDRTYRHIVFLLLSFWIVGCATLPRSPVPHSTPGLREDGRRLRSEVARAERLLEDGRHLEAGALAESLLVVLDRPGIVRTPAVRAVNRRALEALWQAEVLALLAMRDNEPISMPLPSISPWWTEEDLDRESVRKRRDAYLADGGHGLNTWMRRIAPYRGNIMHLLQSEGVPSELWVLTLVESGFNLHARSHAHAVGPWQFVSDTARHYGLLITPDRDQRRDWEASTRAAARYLRDLHREFGDGLLALAAFNCGPSRVRREVKRSGRPDFWSLKLPRETRRYVPRTLALAGLLEEPGGVLGPGDAAWERVRLPHPVRVKDLARACGTTEAELRKLNPAWRRPVTPGDGHAVRARVPSGTAVDVLAAFDAGALPEAQPVRHHTHRVKHGDTLWGISRRYRISLRALLRANGLRGNEIIRPGLLLKVPG